MYSLLLGLFQRIKRSADLIEAADVTYPATKAPITRPALGTIPLRELNAKLVTVPGSDRKILLVNSRMFEVSYIMSAVAAKLVSITDSEDGMVIDYNRTTILRNAAYGTDAAHVFVRAMSNLAGIPHNQMPGIVRNELALRGTLSNAMELFIVGHEYAHLILDHADANRDREAYDSADEMIADMLGLQLMLHAVGVIAPNGSLIEAMQPEAQIAMWGADFALTCMELNTKLMSLVRDNEWKSWPSIEELLAPRHADPSMRRMLLRLSIDYFLKGTNSMETRKMVYSLGDALRLGVFTLWENEHIHIQKLYDEHHKTLVHDNDAVPFNE